MPRCIIIGTGPGVNAAVAGRFGHAGYAVGLIARNPDALLIQKTDLSAAGITCAVVVADAGDRAALTEAFDALTAQNGPFDELIYNAAAMGVSRAIGSRSRPSPDRL